MEMLKGLLSKVPWVLFLIIYLLWLGWDLFNFKTDATSSPFTSKQRELEASQVKVAELEKKKREAEEFFRTLEQKRADLRNAAIRLAEMKATLSEEMDVAVFIKMLVTEAKRVNIKVTGIEPAGEKKEDFYIAQNFKLKFKGVFAQVVVLLERLMRSQRIITVEGYEFSPASASSGRYAELEGTLLLKTYRYNASKADEIAAKETADQQQVKKP